MSSSNFRIDKHVLPSQHIRNYLHGTIDEEEDELYIAINQYTPLDNQNAQPGDLTIIAAHANGVGKELYEPLWDELYSRTKESGIRIRGIWIADVSHQGESGVLNEGKLGNDPSWYDHPRDLLHMVNHFRKQMPRPIIGVGHSMGGNNMVNLALMHPRLMESLILLDPVIQTMISDRGNYNPAYMSTFRRDIWPSRDAAAATFRKNKFYQSWDPRVLDLWIKYGLRNLPTAIYPTYPADKLAAEPASGESTDSSASSSRVNSPSESPVTLTTPKQQEVFTFLRRSYPKRDTPLADYFPSRKTHADMPNLVKPSRPFYRPEPILTCANLPHLRPRCFYIFAEYSDLSNAKGGREEKLNTTGVGSGGSGGLKEGAVKDAWIQKAGHFVPFEKPGETAELMVGWLSDEQIKWKEEVKQRELWAAVPQKEKFTFNDDFLYWMNTMGPPRGKTKQSKSKI